jgi:hypothetical protein
MTQYIWGVKLFRTLENFYSDGKRVESKSRCSVIDRILLFKNTYDRNEKYHGGH